MSERDSNTARERRLKKLAARPIEVAEAENLAKLPPMCAAYSVIDNAPVMIVRGEMGHVPAAPDFDPDRYNVEHEVTTAQRLAMTMGAVFGWHVPAADVDTWLSSPNFPALVEAERRARSSRNARTFGDEVDETEFPKDEDTPTRDGMS